jgi:hypothetical protein
MFNPATLGIIGAATGIVGAISGVVGLVLGWTNYRRLQQIKALDLRLELRKQVSDVHAIVEALPSLLEQSRASRRAVLAAKGASHSSAFEFWRSELESDLKTAHALEAELPDAAQTSRLSKPENLESKLVEIHALAGKAAGLRDKYRMALASDDKEREHIRADARTRFNNADRRVGL